MILQCCNQLEHCYPGASGGQVAKGQVSESTLLQAVTAVHAWGCFVELLGHEFLKRDPPVGPPMLKVSRCLATRICLALNTVCSQDPCKSL